MSLDFNLKIFLILSNKFFSQRVHCPLCFQTSPLPSLSQLYVFKGLFFLSPYPRAFFYYFQGEGKGHVWGGERGRERETLIGCLPYAPWLGTEPATQACTLTGNWTCNPLVYGMTLQPIEHPLPVVLKSDPQFRCLGCTHCMNQYIWFFCEPILGWGHPKWSMFLCSHTSHGKDRILLYMMCSHVFGPNFQGKNLSFFDSIIYLFILRNKTNGHIPGYYFAYGYCYCFLELYF